MLLFWSNVGALEEVRYGSTQHIEAAGSEIGDIDIASSILIVP
jgi:hypothetical protein